MKRVLVLFLVSVLAIALAPVSRSDGNRLSIVRVPVESGAEAQYLVGHFDETHARPEGSVELLLWPGDAAELSAAGFDFEVVVPDVYARDRAVARQPSPKVELPGPDRSDYRRLSDYNRELRGLAEENPSLVRLIKLKERSLEGRTVLGVEIASHVKSADGRPVFYVDGVHHAREWPAGEYPILFAHQLVESYGRDERITSLLKRVRVVIVPIVNVDGFDYSRESVLSADQTVADQTWFTGAGNGFEGYWRKNRRSFTGATAPAINKNPDAFGVDPNRNYSFNWGDDEGGSSGDRFTQTYRGEKPFSEPETRNVRRIILGRNVTGVITNHTSGNLVLRPWGHTKKDPPDESVLAPLGGRMADAMGGYANQKGIGLYITTGTTDDWAYAATAALGFTFEHGEAFHPPYAGSVGKSFEGVLEAFTIMAEASADPDLHAQVTGRVVGPGGRPVAAGLRLTKRFKTPMWPGNPTGRKNFVERQRLTLRTGPVGHFVWHLNPSTRPELESRGATETYTLRVTGAGHTATKRIELDRGERLDLGTIRLTRMRVLTATIEEAEAKPIFPPS